VFLSNLPEGISGAIGMIEGGKSKRFVFSMWAGVTATCGLCSLAGYAFLEQAGSDTVAFILALAAGAILAMISATMIPEAFDDEGRITPIATPLATVAGFLLAFILSRLTG
jgi:ZIP family zinc transporter